MKVLFKDVSLSYDGKANTLEGLNFEIPNGALVSLLGPSGGGKTTTLNMLSGLLPPTTGQIFFDDVDVTKQSALTRKVGMVFQNYALYPHLSVLDNIAFPLKMARIKKAARYQKARELAALVHIENQLHQLPAELSGGQQQRVAIARALAKEPSLLLLDEPLSNLDARLRIEMREEIRRIQSETGVTTIFVTHDQDEALHISDHIMILADGHIQQFATPQALYVQPANLFVAKFIGTPVINTLPAEALRADLVAHVPAESLAQAETVGIRSEAIVAHANERPLVAKIQASIGDTHQFGRDVTASIAYHGHTLQSTALAGVDASTQDFYLLRTGVYLFGADGRLIYGGESDDE